MNRYAIGSGKLFDQLVCYLDRGLQELPFHHINPAGGRFRSGSVWYYTLEYTDGQTDQIVSALAKNLTEFLMREWEQRDIKQQIVSEYTYYDADEVDYLVEHALEFLSYYRRPNETESRKAMMEQEIRQYLLEHPVLNMEGLIRFRLRQFQDDLRIAIEQSIDDYLMDREYQEFVKLLRYFLQAQEPRSPLIHLIVEKDWARIIDHDGFPITNEDLNEFTEDLIDGDIQQDDILISTLITLAPSKVQIHLSPDISDDQILIDTVKRVFEERVSLCKGCTICQTPLELWDQIGMIPLDYSN